jgi:hypothetical protein
MTGDRDSTKNSRRRRGKGRTGSSDISHGVSEPAGTPGIPEILRARGYRLYGRDGQRYTDFYQNAGFAMAGHRPEGCFQALKSSAAKGLWAEYPGLWRRRLETRLLQMFPFVDRIFLYPDVTAAVRDLEAYSGLPVKIVETPVGFWEGPELSRSGPRGGGEEPRESFEVLRWRPFAMGKEEMSRLSEGSMGEVFIPVLPFPGSFLPVPLCRVRGGSFRPLDESPGVYPWAGSIEGKVSPVLEAVLVKAASGAVRLLEHPREDLWSRFELPGTKRFGPFLSFSLNPLDYTELFTDMLKKGILLPPPSGMARTLQTGGGRKKSPKILRAVQAPAIVPSELDEGEAAPLIREMRRRYGIG